MRRLRVVCASHCRMSLPQKASLMSNATRTYSLAVQDVLALQNQPANETRLQSVRVRLPYLRRLVTCCACGGILDDAMVSICDHHYCFECQFKEPVLPIHCRQCRDRIGLQPALQLRTLVLCYHNLCHILDAFYPPGVATGTVVVGTDVCDDVLNCPADRRDPITELLKEARSTVYKCPPSIFRVKVPKESSLPTSLDCSRAASLPGSLLSKSEQPVVGNSYTVSDIQATSGSPLVELEVKQALICNSSSPPGGASIPTSRGDLAVGGEASGEQWTDQGMKECSKRTPGLPSGASLTTNTSVISINDQCMEEQPPAMSVKRRKVNRSWK